MRTRSGRVATSKAYEHLGYENTVKNKQEILEAFRENPYEMAIDDHPRPWFERLVVGSRFCQKFHLGNLLSDKSPFDQNRYIDVIFFDPDFSYE